MKNILVFILLLIISGCGPKPLPLPNLDQIPMPSIWVKDKNIILEGGSYTETTTHGSASQVTISASEYFAEGIINDQQVLAAILTTTTADRGTFYDLFLFAKENDQLHYKAQTSLGNHIEINRIGVTDNMIKVSLAKDGAVSSMVKEPDLPLVKSFIYADQQLMEPCQPEATPAKPNPPPATLAGKTFYWQSSLYGNDTQETPRKPANYSITFNHDWTLDIRSDCSTTGGFFGLSASKLTIRPDLPVEPCSDRSLSQIFLRDLNDAVNFLFQEKNLYIDLIYDSGTLVLSTQM